MNCAPEQLSTVDLAPWWRGAVIYQVYPRSYRDANGDGIGDLPGIIEKLDYIASLGVDAIWLSPFFTSPMKDFGYDVADYRDVDPIFGTLADFDALIAKAHGLGLKIIIDQVYSHTSDQHAWFHHSRQSRDNAYADWYVWADSKADGSPPNNWQSVFGGPSWTWDARRGQYYMHNFLSSQPDLNVHNPAVQNALLETARFWLDRGVDGFRLDAINFAMHDPQLRDNPPALNNKKRTRSFDFQQHLYNQSHPDIPAFLSRIRAVMDAYGARFTVAEVGGERADEEMKLFTHGHDRLHSAYSFTYLYADAMSPGLVRDAIHGWLGAPGEGWPSWAFSNHDAPRAATRWAPPEHHDACAQQMLLLLLCLRGNAFLYQGEELGLPQAHVPFEALQDPEAIANWPLTLGRDGARTPMPWQAHAPLAGFGGGTPWLPVDPAQQARAVDVQEADPMSPLQLTRRLLRLRKRDTALRAGSIATLDLPSPLLGFTRGEGAQQRLCVFNLSAAPVAWQLPAGWRLIEQVNGGDANPLPAYSGLVAAKEA